ncbi:MAG: ABC transporter ATP-binding protein [Lachnospiraceae bacterium]
MKWMLKTTFKIMGKRGFLYLIAIFAMAVLTSLVNVISSVLINKLFVIIEMRRFEQILYSVLSFGGLGIVVIGIWRYFTIIYNREAKYATANLQKIIYEKALKLPLSYYDTHNHGEFLSRLSYNIEKASDIYGSRFRRVVTPVISVIVYIIPMLFLNSQLSTILLLSNAVLLSINLLLSDPMKRISKMLIQIKAAESQIFLSLISGINVVKMFLLETIMEDKYHKILLKWKWAQNKKSLIVALLEGLNSGCDLLCSVVFLGIGVGFLVNGKITLGELTAIYVLYSAFNFHFLQIGRYVPELAECFVYMKDLLDFMEIEEEPLHRPSILLRHGQTVAVQFEDVSFGYQDHLSIFNKFKLKIESGKTTVLTGQSGCGKSTLLKLILGLYEFDSGTITVYGETFNGMGLAELRDSIAYVPQEPYLYHVSIAENISYGKPDATKQEIISAAKMANAHDFIMKQEQGYETVVMERGKSLSGGEKQRIAIARAFLKDAPIILLDEATAALDSESEMLMQAALRQLMKNRTVIMVAHKPATIASADVRAVI